ncbi:MAG: cytochrome c biogenesis protein CcdA [Candidatus Pelagibacterales bacterium]|nr:MAG: cytochrome c biogenesis protein CcdA [Pelagibacterales bacterium]|tara:strand:- start:459 stop:1172 length:714 start_codon:yes stop_codon:yes gene_type:complete
MSFNLTLAFFAGLLSFLSPCVLPLIPGYISYISGQNLNELAVNKKNVLLKSIFFSLGFSFVFIIFGATASLLGKVFITYSNELRIIAGLIIILFSLQFIGIIKLNILNKEKKYYTKRFNNNLFFPILVGAAFGFGWTPCIGPVLGSILALAAVEETFYKSILLLIFYSLGLAIPFILSGYAMNRFLIVSKNLKKLMPVITKTGGSILLITGLLILTNQLQVLGYYILEIFPKLSNLG